jgi:hypothetical protein
MEKKRIEAMGQPDMFPDTIPDLYMTNIVRGDNVYEWQCPNDDWYIQIPYYVSAQIFIVEVDDLVWEAIPKSCPKDGTPIPWSNKEQLEEEIQAYSDVLTGRAARW